MTCRLSNRHRAGTTLVEVLVSALLVGVMIVASLESVRNAVQTHRLNASRMLGPALAEDLMSEALAMPYADPEEDAGALGVEVGELSSTRADFDDIDDFDGWDSADAQTKEGDAMDHFPNWRRQVDVRWANQLNGDVDLGSETGLKRITVTVTSPDGAVTTLEALRSRGGALERPPEADMTAVTWMGAELKLVAHGEPNPERRPAVRHATPLTNRARDTPCGGS